MCQAQPLTNQILATQDRDMVQNLSRQFPILFSDTLGEFEGFQARIIIKKGAVLAYHKHGIVPFAIRKNVEKLSSLLLENIITRLEHREWATPRYL